MCRRTRLVRPSILLFFFQALMGCAVYRQQLLQGNLPTVWPFKSFCCSYRADRSFPLWCPLHAASCLFYSCESGPSCTVLHSFCLVGFTSFIWMLLCLKLQRWSGIEVYIWSEATKDRIGTSCKSALIHLPSQSNGWVTIIYGFSYKSLNPYT